MISFLVKMLNNLKLKFNLLSLSKLATPNSKVVDLIEFKSSLNPDWLDVAESSLSVGVSYPVEKFVKTSILSNS